jgi:hypothetical protein
MTTVMPRSYGPAPCRMSSPVVGSPCEPVGAKMDSMSNGLGVGRPGVGIGADAVAKAADDMAIRIVAVSFFMVRRPHPCAVRTA